ncbi:MAG: iron ABC transporter permease, partial [Clostridium sp.]|nr:iron ABC transporter permease [Clostridium sp.]
MTNKKKSILSIIIIFIILLLGTSIGSSDISLIDTLSIILNKTLNISLAESITAKDISIIWKLRLPRVLLAFLV